jgi:hypothetical protein
MAAQDDYGRSRPWSGLLIGTANRAIRIIGGEPPVSRRRRLFVASAGWVGRYQRPDYEWSVAGAQTAVTAWCGIHHGHLWTPWKRRHSALLRATSTAVLDGLDQARAAWLKTPRSICRCGGQNIDQVLLLDPAANDFELRFIGLMRIGRGALAVTFQRQRLSACRSC